MDYVLMLLVGILLGMVFAGAYFQMRVTMLNTERLTSPAPSYLESRRRLLGLWATAYFVDTDTSPRRGLEETALDVAFNADDVSTALYQQGVALCPKCEHWRREALIRRNPRGDAVGCEHCAVVPERIHS